MPGIVPAPGYPESTRIPVSLQLLEQWKTAGLPESHQTDEVRSRGRGRGRTQPAEGAKAGSLKDGPHSCFCTISPTPQSQPNQVGGGDSLRQSENVCVRERFWGQKLKVGQLRAQQV